MYHFHEDRIISRIVVDIRSNFLSLLSVGVGARTQRLVLYFDRKLKTGVALPRIQKLVSRSYRNEVKKVLWNW